jgi:hypothetical protein
MLRPLYLRSDYEAETIRVGYTQAENVMVREFADGALSSSI